MKETSKFRERYNRWKNGENYWEIRADLDLPKFQSGKDGLNAVYASKQAELNPSPQEPQVLRDLRYRQMTAYHEKQKQDAQMEAVGKGIISMVPLVGTGVDVYDFVQNPSVETAGWALGSGLTEIIPFLKVAKAAKMAKMARQVDKLQTQTDLMKAQLTAQRSLEVYDKLANNPYINPAKADRALWQVWANLAKMRQAERANQLAVYNYNIANNKSLMENTVKPFAVGFAMDSYLTVHNVNLINKQYTQNELRNK